MVQLNQIFKALSDDTRLRIMTLLFQKEMCVCEICDLIGESQPKVSRHLAKLRDAGIVRDERQKQWVFYYLNLNSQTLSDIMNSIIRNIGEHPALIKDKEELKEKEQQNQLCTRERI